MVRENKQLNKPIYKQTNTNQTRKTQQAHNQTINKKYRQEGKTKETNTQTNTNRRKPTGKWTNKLTNGHKD